MDFKKVAVKVVAKYLKKNKMAMCLRDILPSSELSLFEREKVADIVHDVVRWKKIYDDILDETGLTNNPEAYVNLALDGVQKNFVNDDFEIKYSVSHYVATLLKNNIKMIEYLNEKPPTTLCINFNKSDAQEVINILSQEKLPAEKSYLETAIFTSSMGRFSSAVNKYLAHVQDEGSQLISFFVVSLGESILDFCCGNGGKSLAMASISRNKKKIFAFDINAQKRLILEKRLKNYNAKITVTNKPFDKKFDIVFVDAPCTGIGAARRNPEVKYINGPGDYPELQQKILGEAAKKVKKNGYLFYAVCTFTPDETDEVVKNFSKEKNFEISSLNDFGFTQFFKKTDFGAFLFLPKADIFFISLLKNMN
ncbi:MAG: RsmB/NOP family class I SAM-dependent RNA methyltransferase [Candidatus Thermoplasmatota archaeon]|nr:RsmB/NOP family class I SAM-dependent RNA methyltransferase [Candidatus Thermoplasmatota archaeon]